MKLDKNTIIGILLLLGLFIGMFWYNNSVYQNSKNAEAKEKFTKDSAQRVKDSIAATRITPAEKAAALKDSLHRDSLQHLSLAAGFGARATLDTEKIVTVENDVLKANFSTKGGQLKSVELKKYISAYDKKNVVLGGAADDKLSYNINTSATVAAPVTDLYFTPSAITKTADGSQTISFTLADSTGKTVTHEFILKKDNYMIDWNIQLSGANQLLTNGMVNINWQMHPQQHEHSEKYEKQMTNVCFYEDNEFDYISSKTERKFEKPVKWVGSVQQFFNTTLLTKGDFASGQINWTRTADTISPTLAKVETQLQIKTAGTAQVSIPLQLYYGPNDFSILKEQPYEMEKIVNLGRDMYSFVRPINKYIIKPVFNFFAGFGLNYGWVILLLTLFIRLITSPLTYPSYVNGAKMKILRPELDTLKAKFGDDKQAFAMEQMKFLREAGVNQLAGCLPALLQIPIFFALYSFFNSNIALRGQNFLWSDDLSAFDVIAKLPFHIPAYGDHVSLFTITAVITSFLISIYNMANTAATQDNPALKYMPYIFPFILLFVFNNLPSALTWYYTVSNLTTLIIQVIVQKFIIKHDKLVAQIETKRKAPKKTSKWQERMLQVQEQQKKMQEMKDRNKK